MIRSIFISDSDQLKLSQLSADLPHAVMISGYLGIDLSEVLNQIEDLISQNYQVQTLSLSPEDGKKSVSISQIRQLYSQTKTGRQGQQVLLIKLNDIDLLGIEAQNALLKILEEPPRGVHFLIGAKDDQAGLETIRSRAFKLKLSQPSQSQIFNFFDQDEAKLNKLWMLSGGRISQFQKLVNQDAQTESKLNDAKLFATTSSGMKKTELAVKYADSAENLYSFAEDVLGVLKSLFEFFMQQGQPAKAARLGKKIARLNRLLMKSAKLNISKRVLMMMLLEAV